jgi:ubiquinol-cytochrome c reductase cytochrome c1 subunit
MKKLLLSVLVVLGFVLPLAPAAANEGGYPWDSFPRTKMTDQAALQNGARIFTNYCLSCHSATYMRYNRLHDIGLSDDQIKKNLLFATDKVGDTMKTDARPAPGKGLVRHGAARPLGDRPLARRGGQGQRRRLPLHALAHVLSRRRQADRLEQPRVPRHRHAARALAAAGRAARQVRRGQGSARPSKTTHRFAGFEQITPGTLDERQYDERSATWSRTCNGWASRRRERAFASASACSFSSACSSDHLAPQRGVLENRPLDLPPPREAARPSGEAGDSARFAFRFFRIPGSSRS